MIIERAIVNAFREIQDASQIFCKSYSNEYSTIQTEYTHDFSNLVHEIPLLVLKPNNNSELRAVIEKLAILKLPYSLRACGHSSGGYSLKANGVIVQMPTIASLEQLEVEDSSVSVAAGLKWSEVEARLNKQQFTFPVLTNHLTTSVGGTLSAGGYGIRSVKLGPQVDLVNSLDIIMKDGQLSTLSPSDYNFRLALTGMGKLGVISKVNINVEPLRPIAKKYTTTFKSLEAFANIFQNVSAEVYQQLDFFWAESIGNEVIVNTGTLHQNNMAAMFAQLPKSVPFPDQKTVVLEPFSSYFNRADTSYQKDNYHCWSDFGIKAKHLTSFLRFLESSILPDTESFLNRVYVLPVAPKQEGPFFPFDIRHPACEEMTFGVGVYFNMSNQKEIDLALSKRNMMLDKIETFEGRLYLPGFPNSDLALMQKHYKKALSKYCDFNA